MINLCTCGHAIQRHAETLGTLICMADKCECKCYAPVEDPKEPRLHVEWMYEFRLEKYIGYHDGVMRYSIERGQNYPDSILLWRWLDDDNCEMLARVKVRPNLVGADVAGFLKSYAENHLNNTDYFKRKAKK